MNSRLTRSGEEVARRLETGKSPGRSEMAVIKVREQVELNAGQVQHSINFFAVGHRSAIVGHAVEADPTHSVWL